MPLIVHESGSKTHAWDLTLIYQMLTQAVGISRLNYGIEGLFWVELQERRNVLLSFYSLLFYTVYNKDLCLAMPWVESISNLGLLEQSATKFG